MPNTVPSADDLLALVEQNHSFIDLQFTDVIGVVKNITIPVE